MTDSEPTVEIFRDGKHISVKAIMPTWNKIEQGKICIRIPLLGEHVITHALNEKDAETAVNEAFHCFCLVSEKHGMGIENELEYIGWVKQDSDNKDHIILTPNTQSSLLTSLIETGDSRVLELALC